MEAIKSFFAERPAPKVFGVLLGLVAISYVIAVGAEGGLINPDRPRTMDHIGGKMFDYVVKQQDAASIAGDAKKSTGGLESYIAEDIAYKIEERINLHRNIASRKVKIPEHLSTDLNAFLGRDVANVPEACRVSVDGVTARTVLYAPPADFVELLCSSDVDAEKLFDAYIQGFVEKGWLVDFPHYDASKGRGIALAEMDQWSMIICVMNKEVFPGSSTLVYWELESEEYDILDD